MEPTTLARMQVRVVVTVFRAELARLAEPVTPKTAAALQRLRSRSLDLLDEAAARAARSGTLDDELRGRIDAARDEITIPAVAAPSPGSPGDRRE